MCKYASFVLTKDRVFWSKTSESHEEIIREFGLNEADQTGTRINIVRVEISPKDKWADLSKWIYKVDQDRLPDWYDAATDEARTRKALQAKINKALIPIFRKLDAFLASIPKTKFFKPDGKPLKNWKLFTAGSWTAAWAAAWAAARDAARDAAKDAAWDAAKDAARDAARDAAKDAAWDAARDAARDAAKDAALDAAWDAQLLAQIIICSDLKIDPKHVKHAKARWQVWRKGYALLCDVNGVLYVYAKK